MLLLATLLQHVRRFRYDKKYRDNSYYNKPSLLQLYPAVNDNVHNGFAHQLVCHVFLLLKYSILKNCLLSKKNIQAIAIYLMGVVSSNHLLKQFVVTFFHGCIGGTNL